LPRKIAIVDFNRCNPEVCGNGVCKAAQACEYKLLRQEITYETPMTDPSICKACGDCVRTCPQKAIQISTQ